MTILTDMIRRVVLWFRGGDDEHELDTEIAFHIDMEVERYKKQGLGEEEARRQARANFGGIDSTKEYIRDTHSARGIADFVRDLRYSLRTMRRRPAFVLATVATVSIAASTAAIVVLAAYHVFWVPMPHADPERIVVLNEYDDRFEHQLLGVSPGNFLEWESRSKSFASLGIAEPWSVDTTFDGKPASFSAWAVTKGFMEAIGLTPVVGRAFDPSQFEIDVPTQVLLSDRGWSRHFGRDPSAIGQTLDTTDGRLEIVGVLPADVDLPASRDFWLPRAIEPYDKERRSGSWTVGVGRLAAGVTLDSAQADIDRIAATLAKEHPQANGQVGVKVRAYRDVLLSTVGPAVSALSVAAMCFLIVATATVLSIFLARLHTQGGELRMRRALGADLSDLVRQVLAEMLLLFFAVSIVSVAISFGYTRILAAILPENTPFLTNMHYDWFAIGTAVTVTLAIIAVCGLIVVMNLPRHASGGGVAPAYNVGSLTVVGLRRLLIAVQVATAVILLIGATLMFRSLSAYLNTDIGFEHEDRVSVQIFADYGLPRSARIALTTDILESLRETSGVAEVAAVSALPFHPTQIDPEDSFDKEDATRTAGFERLSAHTVVATPGYFNLMNVEVLQGREFTRFDQRDSAKAVIINRHTAERYWPNEEPLGKRISIGFMSAPAMVEIVGVVENTRPFGFDSEHRPEIYFPQSQVGTNGLTYVVRANRNPDQLLDDLQQAVWRVAPQQAIFHIDTVSSLVERNAAPKNFATYVLAIFALGAVGLAVLGMYSLVNYLVMLRLREFGIRMAIGASPRQLQRDVSRKNLGTLLLGIVPGVALALVVGEYIESLLFGVDAFDPPTYLGAVLLIAGVGYAAAWLPVYRAGRESVGSLLRSAR